MTVVYADEFLKRFRGLLPDIQRLYRKQEVLFRKDWRDPRLHVKKLKGEPLIFSFRVTRAYRVLFTLVGPDTALLATIGHRKDVYR